MSAFMIADTCDRVGRRLQAKHGCNPIPYRELVDAVARDCGCKRGSVLPSDRCYNRTNYGIKPENSPVFLFERRGHYRHVGPNYPYTGPLYQKPKGKDEPERVVGHWTNGRLEYTG